ncbi:MAG: cation:proton antiporter [Thermoplasmata archaeon]|nr:cation:proton antiporter [Candidatus Sysuiplasma acidicola]MBX8646554.1 cation:proton antiporter [Candidatus Sysuiplasma acidicola]
MFGNKMDIITAMLLLLGVGLVLGQLFEHFRVVAIAGEIIGGILLGPAVFNIVTPDAILYSISEISLFFIMLLLGIEMTVDLLRKPYRRALPLTMTSFVIPAIMMFLLLYFAVRYSLAASVIVSISIGVPSISIISVLVRNYGLLQKDAGLTMLSSVVLSDLIAFLLLSAFLGTRQLIPEVFIFLIFIIVIYYLDKFITSHSEAIIKAFGRLHATEHGEKIIFGAIIFGGLLVSTIFQSIGITFVLGAFFSGMLISEVVVGKDLLGILTRTLNRMNESFFIPVYFTIAGLSMLIPGASYVATLLALLLLTGVVAAYMNFRMSRKLSIDISPRSTVGFLGARGAVGVVIAGTALSYSLINHEMYSVILFGTVAMASFFPVLISEGKNKPETST